MASGGGCGRGLPGAMDRSHNPNIPGRKSNAMSAPSKEDVHLVFTALIDPPGTPEHLRQEGRPPMPPPVCPLCGGRSFRHWSELLKRWVLTCQGEPRCWMCAACKEWRLGNDAENPDCLSCGLSSMPTCTSCAKDWVCFVCEPEPRNLHSYH